MIRDLRSNDKSILLSMMKLFYSSEAVMCKVDARNFDETFEAALNGSPFLRLLVIEDKGIPVGYALLAFTYSNEVGGTVVMIEELYVSDTNRGKGFGREFFDFLDVEYPAAKRFRLEVMRNNVRAMDLYKRLGYKEFDYMQMVKDA